MIRAFPDRTRIGASVAAERRHIGRRPAAARYVFLAPTMLALGLSGCALPPALSIASYFLDAASYLATGKGPSENILSAAVGQDCALLHVVQGKEICTDYPTQAATMVAPPNDVPDLEMTDPSGRFILIGSFEDGTKVENRVARLDGVDLNIIVADVGGRKVHQIVAGPLNGAGLAALHRQLDEPGAVPVQLAAAPE